jgi:hypothetical protein
VQKILLAFCFILFALPVFAEDMPVHVKADKLNFNHEAGVITAMGSVEIDFENIKIYSDTALIDTNANLATAEGNVRVKTKDYDFKSGFLTYDISSEVSLVFKIKTVLYPSDIRCALYMAAGKVTNTPDVKMGEYGSLTTCDLDDPHYHVESRWFDIYPEDKIVGYLVTFYAGPVPLLWTPYHVYSLKNKRSPYSFVYGQNEVEGRFLKTSFDYFINNSQNGVFYFDTTEIKGPGYGISHDYKLDNANSGNLYLYTIDEKDTKLNDYVIKLTHNIQLDSFSKITLIRNSSFIYQVPSGRKNDQFSSVAYSKSSPDHSLSYSYNESTNLITYDNAQSFGLANSWRGMNTSFNWSENKKILGQRTKSVSDTFSHSQGFADGRGNVLVRANYSSYVTDEGFKADEKLEPRVDVTYKGDFYSMSLVQNWYVDVDEDRYKLDNNYEYLERLPELNVTFNTINTPFFNFDSRAGFARYHEAKYISTYGRMRNITTNRYSAGLGLSRTDFLGLGTTLHTSVGLDQYAYDLGDQRYSLSQAAQLDTSLWNFFSNKTSWGKTKVDGNTPFFFESLGAQSEYIKDTISLYYGSYVNFDISAGYNYLNSTYDDILGNLRVSPNDKVYVTLSSGWSVENLLYRDANLNVTYTPFPKFRNTMGVQYDLNIGHFKAANSEMDLEWGDTWQERFHFKIRHFYDTVQDRYMLQDIAFSKDLHCWEGYLSYSEYLKEFRFGMTLKAFPEYPFSFQAGPSGNYFNSFLDNMHFDQPSPARY